MPGRHGGPPAHVLRRAVGNQPERAVDEDYSRRHTLFVIVVVAAALVGAALIALLPFLLAPRVP